jgi:Flp pilus assembly protein CpaB
MGESLNPSVLSRLIHDWRPDWTRTMAARRAVAAGLVVLSAIAAVRSDPHGDQADIVVAARDLSPGIELTAADLKLEKRLTATVPDGASTAVDKVVGSTLAGPARRGEVLTDVRLLGPRLAALAAGRDARIVPLHLSDTALLDLVRPGDVVDVLAAADDDVAPRVVATDAVVVLVSEKQKGPGAGGDRVVLVALPAHAANDVAGATLMRAVTLTFH